MSRPWKKVGEAAPQDHHIFKLKTLTVADPRSGKEYSRVTLDAPDWANVVAITDDDRVVLIRQFRFGTWSATLEIPGGMLDAGEDPLVAAQRELEEETGYRARHIFPIGITEPNPAIQNNRIHHFLATGCVKVHEGEPDESEDIDVELVPVAKIDDLVMTGAISHSLVVTAFYFWRLKERG